MINLRLIFGDQRTQKKPTLSQRELANSTGDGTRGLDWTRVTGVEAAAQLTALQCHPLQAAHEVPPSLPVDTWHPPHQAGGCYWEMGGVCAKDHRWDGAKRPTPPNWYLCLRVANSPETKLYPSGCFAPTALSSTPTLSRWDNPRNTQVGLHLLERETELTFQVEDLFFLVFLSTDAACLDECFSCFVFSFLIYGICSF